MLICENVKKNLEPFGWSPEDAEWVAMVCLHSGVFTRAQYSDYFNTYPNRARRFVQSLVDLKLAVDEEIPVITTQNRTKACRITHKSIYRELGVPNIRHRRIADPAVYLRRLLSLDYVIERPDLDWLPTEDEKVAFCKHLDIGKDRLPKRVYTGAAGNLIRYFPPEIAHCRGPGHQIRLCRSRERNRHRNAVLGPGARACLGQHTKARDAGSCRGHSTRLPGRKSGARCLERMGAGSDGHQGRELPGGGIAGGV